MGENPPHPRKRRRLFSFTLRTLLIVLTAASLWLGWRVNRAHRQREAVAAIVAFGGSVSYDFESAATVWPHDDAPAPPEPAWLIDVVGVDLFHRVEYASLLVGRNDVSTEETAKAVAALEDLPHLRTLDLCGEQATDETLARLASMKHLEELSLGPRMDWTIGRDIQPKVTPDGLRQLAVLKRLRSLTVDGAALDDEALKAIESLTSLEVLCLYGPGCRFSEEARVDLANREQGKELRLYTEKPKQQAMGNIMGGGGENLGGGK
jgi:hypothetical protein